MNNCLWSRGAADLHAGRKPNPSSLVQEGLTVKEVSNLYLTYQMQRAETKEISTRWFQDCLCTVRHFSRFMGASRLVSDIRPEDFHQYRQELLSRGLTGRQGLGVYALDRSIIVVKAIFDHAYQTCAMDQPMRYGKMFKQSSAAAKRKSKASKQAADGKRVLEAPEIRALLENAGARVGLLWVTALVEALRSA